MPHQSKVIAFDVDQAILSTLHKAFPNSVIEVVNGATAGSLTRDWNPGTVDLLVVKTGRRRNGARSEPRRPCVRPELRLSAEPAPKGVARVHALAYLVRHAQLD
jgi:hypothetical protein